MTRIITDAAAEERSPPFHSSATSEILGQGSNETLDKVATGARGRRSGQRPSEVFLLGRWIIAQRS